MSVQPAKGIGLMDSATKWADFLDQFGARLGEKLGGEEIQALYALVPGVLNRAEQLDQSTLPALFALQPNSPETSEKLIELWTIMRQLHQQLAGGVELIVKLSYLTSPSAR